MGSTANLSSEPRWRGNHAQHQHQRCVSADSSAWRLRIVQPVIEDLGVQQQRVVGGDATQRACGRPIAAHASARPCRSANQSAQWYSGYDQLLNPAIDLFNDAFYDPKMVVVPVIPQLQEILNNEGEAQLMDVFDSYMARLPSEALEDAMDAGIYSDGTANGGQADHRVGDRTA